MINGGSGHFDQKVLSAAGVNTFGQRRQKQPALTACAVSCKQLSIGHQHAP